MPGWSEFRREDPISAATRDLTTSYMKLDPASGSLEVPRLSLLSIIRGLDIAVL